MLVVKYQFDTHTRKCSKLLTKALCQRKLLKYTLCAYPLKIKMNNLSSNYLCIQTCTFAVPALQRDAEESIQKSYRTLHVCIVDSNHIKVPSVSCVSYEGTMHKCRQAEKA